MSSVAAYAISSPSGRGGDLKLVRHYLNVLEDRPSVSFPFSEVEGFVIAVRLWRQRETIQCIGTEAESAVGAGACIALPNRQEREKSKYLAQKRKYPNNDRIQTVEASDEANAICLWMQGPFISPHTNQHQIRQKTTDYGTFRRQLLKAQRA